MSHQISEITSLEKRQRQLDGEKDAALEWQEFVQAIKQPRPALEIFSSTALMLIYLQLGREALKEGKT